MLPHVNPQQWNKTYWKGEKTKTINFNLNTAFSQCNLLSYASTITLYNILTHFAVSYINRKCDKNKYPYKQIFNFTLWKGNVINIRNN